MKKRVFCIVLILLLALSILSLHSVQATDLNSISDNGNDLSEKTGQIVGLIQVIGYSTAVIMAVVIGIKFLCADPSGKASIKQQLVPYVIGILILIAVTIIITVGYNLGKII